ncbi:MAG: tetratricopeptide repeat protein [Rhodospirillaceae bacterium]|jgi:tetratricopeptide (TPR) repeat protein|nr:tetratricopeptide repeat protein [Rhodospirillaceae bacterium]MBT5665871.1 tetratricopeptide repeat protein [Rhodospirillaceae bacterium]MBT5809911.1 tetratricopeptide repeat protein [Rhodospirillaceae bacterium]
MFKDERGLELTAANADAVAHFNAMINAYLGLRLDTGDHLKALFAADSSMPMAHIVNGYFFKLFCTPVLEAKAKERLASARALGDGATDRERAHIEALDAWCRGDLVGATARWEDILLDHPRDVLALRLAHFTHFYLGASDQMRDSIARVLPYWDETTPGYWFVQGFHAFGLEESGDYAAAEAIGRQAVEKNPEDIWTTHAVAHVYEMQGRHRDGVKWLTDLAPNWGACNNFAYHTWWHLGLYHLELEQFDRVLDLYDTRFRNVESEDYLDITNAIAMLWRLGEQGVDVGDRWRELADKSETKTNDHILAFIDVHYGMALAVEKRFDAADALAASMPKAKFTDTTEAPIYDTVGRPLLGAIIAYEKGDYRRAVELLAPVRYDVRRIGGSHAQRDLFQRLLISAALKADEYRFARALLSERTALNPNGVWGWKRTADALDGLGALDDAARAREAASSLLSDG